MILFDEAPFSGCLPSGVVHVVVAPGTTIGQKLNLGVATSSSDYFHKWDDDDGYSPPFLSTLINPLLNNPGSISLVARHLVFIIRSWQMYAMPLPTLGGGTICFDRKTWLQRKFGDLSFGEDQDFIHDRRRVVPLTPDPLNYVLIRHGENTWKTWSDGKTVEEIAKSVGTLVPGGPESFFSAEDLSFYRGLRNITLSHVDRPDNALAL